ncbi:MAG: hypothetical protein LC795_20750 [Acidobacteria bacterium]|nr:hypothetical protein [Acidobacteriota bacterium]
MGRVDAGQTLSWYAVHTQPKQESRADFNLRAWRVETFYPKIRERRFNSFTGGAIHVTQPLFRRYIFAKFRSDELLHKVRFTRGVHSVVSFDNHPARVADEIIELIRSRVGEDGVLKDVETLNPGDSVRVEEGPLKGFNGILEGKVKPTGRVSILLSAMGFQGHIIIPREAVSKLVV